LNIQFFEFNMQLYAAHKCLHINSECYEHTKKNRKLVKDRHTNTQKTPQWNEFVYLIAAMYQLIHFKVYNAYLTKEALNGFGKFQIRRHMIRTFKYVYDLVLLAEEEGVIQGLIYRLNEIERCYGRI